MIFSYKKLRQLANLDAKITLENVLEAINSIGFEVESYQKFNNIEGVKFGRIKNIYKNPNADKLNVCEIEFADKDRVIQTVATNVKQNDYVMAFVPGSTNGKMIFAEKKLQGINSEGMLVSLNELGFDTNLVWDEFKEGIFTFQKVNLQENPLDLFDLDDYLIDIKILSNRSDANSYLIMAKELAAFFLSEPLNINYKNPTFNSNFIIKNNENNLLTGIEAKKDGNFKLNIQDSFLLLKSGIKLVSPIVDLTNLTLIMSGMPTHAYNKNTIKSPLQPQIFSGKFEALGNKIVDFTNALAIYDGNNQAVSLAGVMGAEKTSITKDTKEIIFEIGNFSIKDVRHTAKQLKIDSNSYKQSSKKVSLGTMLLGHHFLSNYLTEFSQIINLPKIEQKSIYFDINYINRIAGSEISKTERFATVKKSLEILSFEFKGEQIIVPNYRHDIEDIDDILEEVLRFYGFNNLILNQPKINSFLINRPNIIKEKISSSGFQEVWTYSLISKERNVFNPFDFKQNITLETFVSKEREEIRNSLAISLAEVIEYNQKRKITDISIFEVGMVNEFKNVLVLASTSYPFNQLKEVILNNVSENLTFKRAEDINNFHTGTTALIYHNNTLVGWIGKISPYLNISDALFAEINLDAIEKEKVIFKEYDNSPLKSRDITFSLTKRESIENVINELYALYQNIFSIKIKDKFETEIEVKITLNILCDEIGMKLIDQKYN
ncbi:phenylalanine--tRNA ligase subunit beta [Mycoplasma sp. 1012]